MPWEGPIPRASVASKSNLDIARGLEPGVSSVSKFGRNDVVGTTTEDIWAAGGKYPWPTTATTVRIAAGGNAADAAAGAGARSVTVVGLDENWMSVTETLTTAGASASASSTTTFFRVFRAFVADVGTYGGSNIGDITIENTAGIATLAFIGAGLGQTQLALYTVPAGHTFYLARLVARVESTKSATVRFMQRQDADVTSVPVRGNRLIRGFSNLDTERSFTLEAPISIPAKTDLWAEGETASSTASVNCAFDGYLVAD